MNLSPDYTRVAAEAVGTVKVAFTALGERFGASIAIRIEAGGFACGVVFPGNQLPENNEQGDALLAELERVASQHGYTMLDDPQDSSIYHFTPMG